MGITNQARDQFFMRAAAPAPGSAGRLRRPGRPRPRTPRGPRPAISARRGSCGTGRRSPRHRRRGSR
ncbi:MAG: hypothetical protein E6J65_01465 [Deltaproteobacteria bacterium]|nr:MAG: hypothetical protein E6J65_01465 [Deltaproteobacteria bacterium]